MRNKATYVWLLAAVAGIAVVTRFCPQPLAAYNPQGSALAVDGARVGGGVALVRGARLEQDGHLLLKVGDSEQQVRSILGPPDLRYYGGFVDGPSFLVCKAAHLEVLTDDFDHFIGRHVLRFEIGQGKYSDDPPNWVKPVPDAP